MKKLIKWWNRKRTFRKSFNELNSLSDRQLKDIGIDRSHIERLAFEVATGDRNA